jgi:NTP pyrophosphatase (non-canonical NTP hydrolase)
MNFDEYTIEAKKTAIFPKKIPDTADENLVGLLYCGLKLNGEAGEVAEHIGKALRDDGGVITEDRKAKLFKEIGDVQWYIANITDLLNGKLSAIAFMNLEKLRDRSKRGVLGGSGSDR